MVDILKALWIQFLETTWLPKRTSFSRSDFLMAEIALHCKVGDDLMASVCPPRFDFSFFFPFFFLFSVGVGDEMSDFLRLYPRLEFL